MTDEHHESLPTLVDPIDDSDDRDGDWEPTMPETTEHASHAEKALDSDAAAREQERQPETSEERPS